MQPFASEQRERIDFMKVAKNGSVGCFRFSCFGKDYFLFLVLLEPAHECLF